MDHAGEIQSSRFLLGITEPCGVADTAVLAVELSDAGLGDYWDDVDHIVRNHLIAQQISDLDRLRQISGVEAGSEGEKLLKRFLVDLPMGIPQPLTGISRGAARLTAHRPCTMPGTASRGSTRESPPLISF